MMHKKSYNSLYKKTILLTSIITINNESPALEDVANTPQPRFSLKHINTENPFRSPSIRTTSPSSKPTSPNTINKQDTKNLEALPTSIPSIASDIGTSSKRLSASVPEISSNFFPKVNIMDTSSKPLSASVPEISSDSHHKDSPVIIALAINDKIAEAKIKVMESNLDMESKYSLINKITDISALNQRIK